MSKKDQAFYEWLADQCLALATPDERRRMDAMADGPEREAMYQMLTDRLKASKKPN